MYQSLTWVAFAKKEVFVFLEQSSKLESPQKDNVYASQKSYGILIEATVTFD